MADTKITGLTNFDSSNTPYWPPAPASDVIPIVDVSDTTMAGSGTTKKISINNLLSSSPTATGALTVTGLVTAGSATITGAATVGTTLGVTGQSTLTGSVGIGASPTANTILYTRTALATDRGFASDNNLNADFVVQYASGLTTIGAELNVPLAFKTNNIERMRLTGGNLSLANGNVVMTTSGTGIDFSAVTGGTGTATANVLNDYEEGTFTPTVAGSTAAGTLTATTAGYYTKVGNLVTVQVFLGWTNLVGATGSMILGGLPFQSSSSTRAYSAASFGYVDNISLTALHLLTGLINPSTTYVELQQYPTGGGVSAPVAIDTVGTIAYTATYRV
jgi:hypothetical protein